MYKVLSYLPLPPSTHLTATDLTTTLLFEKERRSKCCGQDTELCGLLANLKRVCGLTCMQVGWLQAGAEQEISLGIRLPIVAEQQDLSH